MSDALRSRKVERARFGGLFPLLTTSTAVHLARAASGDRRDATPSAQQFPLCSVT